MPYYLHHYFNPDFDHQNLKPKELEKGRVDYYNLDYVQNVIKDQVVAEWKEISEQEVNQVDSRFVSDKIYWPLGPNVAINPANKRQIIATQSGYVFYFEGKIAVKTVLNVRRDVDFNTGNIFFVGDMIVHGTVRSGFEIKARNIRVKNSVEGALVSAGKSLVVEGGVKGADKAKIAAEENIKLAFCEKAKVRAGKKLLIEGSALHSYLFGREYIMVQGRLQGGRAVSTNLILAKDQIGGGLGCFTEIILGYDSDLLQENFLLEQKIKELNAKIQLLKLKVEKSKTYAQEVGPQLDALKKTLFIFQKKRTRVQSKLDAKINLKAKLICPGKIRPGVEISIGPYFYKVDDFLENGRFELEDDNIVFKQPALPKSK